MCVCVCTNVWPAVTNSSRTVVEQVLAPAVAHVAAHLDGSIVSPVPVKNDAAHTLAWRKYKCEVCDRVLDGEHEWKTHQQSRKHRRMVQRAKRIPAEDEEASREAKRQRRAEAKALQSAASGHTAAAVAVAAGGGGGDGAGGGAGAGAGADS